MKNIFYLITEPEGLHALPATALIAKINKLDCDIEATLGNYTVNAKSPFGLMALGAHCDDTIIFKAEGPEEDQLEPILLQETLGQITRVV